MRFCSIFGAVLRKFLFYFYFYLRYCSFTKQNGFGYLEFNAVCGFPMLFFAVFKRMSVLLSGVFTRLPTLTPPSNFDLKTELGHYKISPDRTTATPRDANWFAHERPKKLSATYTSRLFFSLHLNVPEAYLKLKILSFLYKSLTWISQISDVKLLWSQYVLLRTIMAHVLLNKKSRVLLIS